MTFCLSVLTVNHVIERFVRRDIRTPVDHVVQKTMEPVIRHPASCTRAGRSVPAALSCIVDLTDDNEAFHVLYDLSEREQIPGIRALMSNRTWEGDGRYPHWRGIMDDQDRVMVAINFNQDIGDAWEHADDARYPARLTTQAYRLGVNYVVYALTH